MEALVSSSVSLTSPSVEIDASGKRLIVLTSDANQTGAWLSGGVVGQVVTVVTGSGSNTVRFDDGTSVVAGGNITVTEGQRDVIELLCVDGTYGSIWVVTGAHDN